MATTVIGFLSYEDFIAELEQISRWSRIVRVQDYYRRHQSNGIPWVRFFVEAAAVPESDTVLVCRFDIGGGVAYEEQARKQDQENSSRAVELLTTDLIRRGFTVRAGIVAAAREFDGSTTCGLWRYEDGALLPTDAEGNAEET